MTHDSAVDGVPAARPVGGRHVVGAVTGLVGVVLAATTTIWPTKVLAVRMPEVGDFTRGSEQWLWSWGRDVVHYISHGVVLDDDVGPQPFARLVLLVAVLVLAAAGLLTWLVAPGRRGELCAATGSALALGAVATSVVDRVSFDDRTIGLQPGLVSVTTTAGWLEVASVVLLAAALAVALVPVLLPGPTAALAGRCADVAGRLAARRASAVERPAGDPGPAAPPVARPVATLRDDAPLGTTRTPSVGFSDDGDESPGGRHD